MSARPRPVTATFQPKSMAPPTGVRIRSYSLSSGGSTDSLVSVLDHDSYESLEDYSEVVNKAPKKTACSRKVSEYLVSETTETETPQDVQRDVGVAAWEKWMVAKAKEARLRQKSEIIKQKKQVEASKKEEEEKKEKAKVQDEKLTDWMKKKDYEEKLQKKRNLRQEKVKEEVEKVKKDEIQQKSLDKYQDWLTQKKNHEQEKRKIIKEQKKKELEEKEQRQEKCKEAFDKWCDKAQRRPKSVHSSLGYTSGKLTGYYDTNAYPMPSFCNPLPWHPVEMPKQKTQKKRSKSARRWNPERYF